MNSHLVDGEMLTEAKILHSWKRKQNETKIKLLNYVRCTQFCKMLVGVKKPVFEDKRSIVKLDAEANHMKNIKNYIGHRACHDAQSNHASSRHQVQCLLKLT